MFHLEIKGRDYFGDSGLMSIDSFPNRPLGEFIISYSL